MLQSVVINTKPERANCRSLKDIIKCLKCKKRITQILIVVVWNMEIIFSWKWAGHVARMGEERGVYRVLLGKPERRRPLGRLRRRWVDNIRMDLQEVGCGHMDWIGLAQDRDSWWKLVSTVMNLSGYVKCGEFLD